MSNELGSLTERLSLVIEAQKTWGEKAALELAEQLGVKIPSTAETMPSARGEQSSWPKFQLRLPPDAKRWIAQKAANSGSSQNSEIVRAIRQSMQTGTLA